MDILDSTSSGGTVNFSLTPFPIIIVRKRRIIIKISFFTIEPLVLKTMVIRLIYLIYEEILAVKGSLVIML